MNLEVLDKKKKRWCVRCMAFSREKEERASSKADMKSKIKNIQIHDIPVS